FSTTFPTTLENLGSPWTVGDNNGQNSLSGPKTTGGTPGLCYSRAPDGVDYLATIQGQFSTTKHYAEVTIRRNGSYTAPDTQEIELLVGFTLGSGVTVGYELDIWFGGSQLQPVRWDGVGTYDFSSVSTVSGSWPGSVSDGDVVRAVFDSSSGSPVIEVYLNGVLQITYTDTSAGKHVSGSPGLGFFTRDGTGYDATGYCAKGFAAGNG
ncbi:MAG TPA: hypothetical protein VFS24_17335, partial [Steroidobacteraceae bacterium]|nr:hypothetical protein [Steroidobacteraceae bacterium]